MCLNASFCEEMSFSIFSSLVIVWVPRVYFSCGGGDVRPDIWTSATAFGEEDLAVV
jgi:hypothetical protein